MATTLYYRASAHMAPPVLKAIRHQVSTSAIHSTPGRGTARPMTFTLGPDPPSVFNLHKVVRVLHPRGCLPFKFLTSSLGCSNAVKRG